MQEKANATAYVLGIDTGTSGLKLCLLDENGRQAALVHASYRFWSPAPSWSEIDPGSLWEGVLAGLHSLRDDLDCDLSRVAAIGFSSLCPALAALDEDGRALAGIIPYSDRRSTKQADEILSSVGADRLFTLTGNGSMAGGFSGSSLLWLRDERPEVFAKARWFGHLNTFLAMRMTGEAAMDPTSASYTNLYDVKKEVWSGELCEALDIRSERLPKILRPYEPAGELICPELTDLGIPKGIPVVIGAGDTPCAALAAGACAPGTSCESAGTTDVLTVCVDEPRFDRRFINRSYFDAGTWAYQGSMSFTGAANEWFASRFYERQDRTERFAASNAEAASAKPGCGGVVFLPYLQGERSPVWDPYARGVFFGLTLNTTRADMSRAVLESCGYGLRHFLALTETLTGSPIDRLTSIGGGAKSAVWAQIKADITRRPVDVLCQQDSAAIGAALLAGVGAGLWPDVQTASLAADRRVWRTFDPDSSMAGEYERNYEVYQKLYPALKDLFPRR